MTTHTDLIARLRVIANAIADGNYSELTMRIPAEPDRDADIVVMRSALALESLEQQVAALTKERDGAIDWMQARMNEQLAASQAREAKLRWALADDSFAITFQSMGQYRSALLKLALPTDDSALQERLKEERERCAKLIENYDTCGDNTQAWQDRFAEAIRGLA